MFDRYLLILVQREMMRHLLAYEILKFKDGNSEMCGEIRVSDTHVRIFCRYYLSTTSVDRFDIIISYRCVTVVRGA